MITFSNLGNMGRLGNQFFQVASTIGVANKNNHDYRFPEWAVNKYLKNPIPTGFVRPTLQVIEKGCDYETLDLECEADISVDLLGYFQSERYFKDSNEAIQSHFTPSDELNEEIEKKYGFLFGEDVASVHVRMGDYLNLTKIYHRLSMEYFLECVEEAKVKKIIFFSDDIKHCKDVFRENNKDFMFISERVHDDGLIAQTKSAELDAPKHIKEDLFELFLMSKCRTNIICNSTYGWWAAWLNNHPDKQVFAPDKWFTPEHLNRICAPEHQENYLNDIVPESWKRR